MSPSQTLPLVFTCGGGSHAAELAHRLARRLDAEGLATHLGIAGVGGAIPEVIDVCRSGRPILAINCCPLQCASACLRNANLPAEISLNLVELPLKHLLHQAPGKAEEQLAWAQLVLPALEQLNLKEPQT